MIRISHINPLYFPVFLFSLLLLLPAEADAQRLKHRAPRTTGRAAPSARPARPSGRINGGAVKSSNRFKNVDRSRINTDNMSKARDRASTVDRSAAKTKVENVKAGNETNIGNRTNIGNKVDIDTGDKNVNINIDNSKDINIERNRNTVVRRSPVVYRRPPYSYGGFHFYCHFGYNYHPYRPYYWGPSWHPWGFFLATLTATAIVVSIDNQQYHYDQGVFYEESDGGYTAVEAPNGAVVPEIPPGAEQVTIEQNVTNNYYYGGAYYEKSEEGYTVVPPTAGAVVENLPEGAEEVRMGDVTYVKYGDTYYQPVQVEGVDKYEVAQVEPVE